MKILQVDVPPRPARFLPISSPRGDPDLRPLPSIVFKIFPLNSKRLTSQYVVTIAKAMGLLTKGTVEEMKLIIEGRLTDMDREPRNIQVEVEEGDRGRVTVRLRESRGTFVEALASPLDTDGTGAEGETEADFTEGKASADLEEART